MANLSRIMGHSFQVVPFPGVPGAGGSQKFKLLAGSIINGSTVTAVAASDFTISEKSYVWIDTLTTVGAVTVNTTATAGTGMRLIAVVTLSSVSQHVLGDIIVGPGTSSYFRVTVRPEESAEFEYMVEAGGIYLPNGVAQAVAAKAWAAAPVGNIYLNLSINEGTVTATYAETVGTVAIAADPATLSYYIAGITEEGNVVQIQNGPIDLTGSLIPAWYAGYTAASYQQLYHAPNAAPSWVTVYDCADGEEYTG